MATYGQIATALGVFMFLGVIFDFGLTTFTTRLLSFDPDSHLYRPARYATRISSLALLLLAVLIAVGWSQMFTGHTTQSLLAVTVGIAIWASSEKYIEARAATLIASRRNAALFRNIVTRRIMLVFPFAALHFAAHVPPLASACIAQCIGSAVGIVQIELAAFQAERALGIPRAERPYFVSVASTKEVLIAATSFNLTEIPSQVKNLDAFLITVTASAAQAGYYSTANRLSAPIFLLSASLATSVFPALRHSRAERSRAIVRWIVILIPAAIAVILAIIPFSDEVMRLVFGHKYGSSGMVLVAVLAATVCNAAMSPLTAVIQSNDQQVRAAFGNWVFAVLFVIFVPLGAVLDGAVGGALGYFCAAVASVVYLLRIFSDAMHQAAAA